MSDSISRNCDASRAAGLTDDVNTTEVIRLLGFVGVGIVVPTGAFGATSPTTITWYASNSDDEDAEFVRVTDSVGVDLAVTAIQEARAIPIPLECSVFAFLRAVLDSGTADVMVTRKA